MAAFFFDSSAIVKRYVTEIGTAWVKSLTNPQAGHELLLVRVTGAEMVSALVRHLTLADPTLLTTALHNFRVDFRGKFQIVDATDVVVERAMSLAETHRLRGYDAVQLAAAAVSNDVHLSLSLPPITMVTADSMLIAAAATEGLAVENPNQHP